MLNIYDNNNEYLSFKVNDVNFAINSKYIDSIASTDNITDIPKSSMYIDGMVSFRSRVIPVINLGEYLFSKRDNCNNNLVIICNIKDKAVALRISSINFITKACTENIYSVGSILKNRLYMISGYIADENKNITQILDLDKVIDDIDINDLMEDTNEEKN